MAAAGLRSQKAPYKRLPSIHPNITELTAIARIKPGLYPEERLLVEIASESSGKKNEKWLASQNVPGKIPEKTWLDHLKTQGKHPKMTWHEHLKAVLDWAHIHRQEAIKKMTTIHYARWVIVDHDVLPGIDGPHVFFTSNFDGLLVEYLEDFAAVDEGPLNLIFGHCVGWPGARPASRFIQYVEEHRHSASVFYANYPKTTVEEVRRALDWKTKTQKFIEQDIPQLEHTPPTEWEAVAKRLLKEFLNELAKPTPKTDVP